jgi:hypothetical protein
MNIIPSKQISKLDLSNLNLKEIPQEVFELKNLKKLDLSNNQLKTIPKEISNLKQLEVLDISNNNISNFFAKLCEIKKLKALNLNNNKIASIPKQISGLKKLRSLNIANNKIKKLPVEFSELSELVLLNISKNPITEFPDTLYELKNLKQLWICNLTLKNFYPTLITQYLVKLKSIYTYGVSIDKTLVDINYYKLSKVKGNSIGKLLEIVQDLKYRTMNNETMNIDKKERTEEKKSMIFISYSHKDSIWLERVQTNLKVLKHQNIDFELWDDTRILGGHKWKEEIQKALELSKVAILIVSTDFLASDFIQNDELPILLKNAEKKGNIILPLIVGHSRFIKDKRLNVFQSINDPSKPLSGCDKTEYEKILVSLTDRVEDILNA